MDPPSQCAGNVIIPNLSIKSNVCVTSSIIFEGVLREKYLKNNLSMRDIAGEFECSKNHVRDLLLKYKIPIRVAHLCHKDHSRIYGKRTSCGEVVEHKGEQKTLVAIKRMYQEEGIHPRAIARILNSMRVPTKQQGKSWHHHTVITLLKREGVYKPKTIQGSNNS